MTTVNDVETYEVRIWNISRHKGARGTTYTLRWSTAGHRHQRTFRTAKLAEAFRTDLTMAARAGIAFEIASGLPRTMQPVESPRTWLDHAMQYVRVKWPAASPRHRKGIAEALTDISIAILPKEAGAPPTDELRRALYSWAFNIPAREGPVPDDLFTTFAWLERVSPRLVELEDAALLRQALDRLSLKKDGTSAAASTTARKRATLHSVLEYAVELENFSSNPLKRVRWRSQRPAGVVDRRVVVNPKQARRLLQAVCQQDPALAGFFACMYFAGLRPAEARNLRIEDCTLPETGWGKLLLTGSHQTSGTAWTDNGATSEERGLKHRNSQDTRSVPAHPELVSALRRHSAQFQLGPDGRFFVTRTARYGIPLAPPFVSPVSMGSSTVPGTVRVSLRSPISR